MPIPVKHLFTYSINEAEYAFLKQGMRVAVPFGKTKIYTALVHHVHQNPPTAYEAKEIYQIVDEFPVVSEKQIQLWEWIASYYQCYLGEIFRAAIPSSFLLESETILSINTSYDAAIDLDVIQDKISNAIKLHGQLSISDVQVLLDKKNVLLHVKPLIDVGYIQVKEEIYDTYKPKLLKFLRLQEQYKDSAILEELVESLNRAKKQREIILAYLQLEITTKKPVAVSEVLKKANSSSAIVKALEKKGVFEIYTLQTDRVSFDGKEHPLKELNTAQQEAFEAIEKGFSTQKTILLHGVTSSGKTEVYAHLMQKVLAQGKQVLFLLPEIALTAQLISRLQKYFANKITVFHSKYSMNERVEAYRNILANKDKAQLIIGVRSAVFLPFQNLGLIIVDESHETSYKQYDPAPRYHARDVAIVLSRLFKANILLGSATPSIESFYNAQIGKYQLVSLTKRHGNVQLPKIELVDLKDKYKRKRMQGHFSDRLIKAIEEALELKEQIILFQNRRGYAPIVSCNTCGTSPQCPNCDVSLNFHKYTNRLQCHYCGYQHAMLIKCMACGTPNLDTKGFGTEQIEQELKDLFPKAKTARMDLDTTRGKHAYQKLISKFEKQDIDILVGTQMLSKGLDFGNVTLVGVLSADAMLNFPDFRAHERSFQLLVQVAGRAGRKEKQGLVLIQSFNPYHQILQQVSTNNYLQMYKEQLHERHQFHYPPFYRTIKIVLKHRNFNTVEEGSRWLYTSLYNSFREQVLGPTTPSIGRIRNDYIRHLIIKIPPKQSIKRTKEIIEKAKNTFQAIPLYRAIRFNLDVDNY